VTRQNFSILFLGKKDDAHCDKALEFSLSNFTDVTACLGKWGDPIPGVLSCWKGDYIFSYLSRWIVPDDLLKRTKSAAINFHPGSPDYPGVGCTNFALYDEITEYGVTCHHMAPRVDTGPIIAVKRFPVFPTDNVESLMFRTYDSQLLLFHEIAGLIVEGKQLPVSEEKWTRKPFTRNELNRLARITPLMNREEIARRIRATQFGNWKPTVERPNHSPA